ncbi:hypothetical protein [Helicobacter sp. 16-1353]|uniref:hypothetical protein n=1 Tax=Helicobacter sp. 16-1353 TaxID=2004996 RepID=UPI0015EF417C|nr:hypothetical protein [Helicobacter sp. 16-1353]
MKFIMSILRVLGLIFLAILIFEIVRPRWVEDSALHLPNHYRIQSAFVEQFVDA